MNFKVKYNKILADIRERDKSDYTRKISPLKITKDSILIDTTNLSIKKCFMKIKNIIDKSLEKK